MENLLEVLLTFVGIILLLALAAQSLQELIKSGFALKSMAARSAFEGLVVEATRASGQLDQTGRDIAAAVVKRLRGLGQAGYRKESIRLDKLDAAGLESLILSVNTGDVNAIKQLPHDVAQAVLQHIGARAREWFGLSADPVDERYRRRMRFLALGCSAAVVLLLNADTFYLFRAAQGPEYRAEAAPLLARQDSLYRLYRAARADSAQRPRAESLWVRIDSVSAQLMRPDSGRIGFLVGDPGGRRWTDPLWILGIIVTTLLVSMGAPFWHDTLESLMGLKNRIRAQADQAEAVASGQVPSIKVVTPTKTVVLPTAPDNPDA